MNKLIDPNDYIKLSTYANKYDICSKKLYRYVNNDTVDYVVIDGIPFIRDEPFMTLETDHRVKMTNYNVPTQTLPLSNVPTQTLPLSNVPTQTLDDDNNTDNQVVSNVPTQTLGNVPTRTIREYNVPTQTLLKRLNELEAIPENDRKIKDFKEIEEIRKKL